MMNKILITSNYNALETHILDLIQGALEVEVFDCFAVKDPFVHKIILVAIDCKKNDLQRVHRFLREHCAANTIIAVISNASVGSRISKDLLDDGVHDVMITPDQDSEIITRLKRCIESYHEIGHDITIGDVTLKKEGYFTTHQGEIVKLTPLLTRLLSCFFKKKDTLWAPHDLYYAVTQRLYNRNTNTLRTSLCLLNKRLAPHKLKIIHIRSVGYRLDPIV